MFFKKINTVWIFLNFIAVMLICLNIFILFNKCEDSTWMLAHKTVVTFLTVASLVCMLLNLYQSYSGQICLADFSHPTSVNSIAIACLLAICVSCSHGYTIVFNFVFKDCDRLIETKHSTVLWLDNLFNLLMMAYPAIVVLYVIEIKRSQPSHSLWNNISATFVNCTLVILWARVLIYKSLMHQPEVFVRLLEKFDGHKEKLPFFFPCVSSPHYYCCQPQKTLKGTRMIWHDLDEGLIHSIIVSATAEFFPVIRVLNHFTVGLIDQKKLADGSMHRNTEVDKSNMQNENSHRNKCVKEAEVCRYMPSTSKEQSSMLSIHVFDEEKTGRLSSSEQQADLELETPKWMKVVLILLSVAAAISAVVHCHVELFFNMNLDELTTEKPIYTYMVSMTACGVLCSLFSAALLVWIRRIKKERLSEHLIQETQPDFLILGTAACLTTLEMVAKLISAYYMFEDNVFLGVLQTMSPIIFKIFVWMQYLGLKRAIALTEEHIQKTKGFFGWVVLAGIIVNTANFITTFLHSCMLKNAIEEEEYDYSMVLLFVFFAIQFLMPAEYLYNFTMAGIWSYLLMKYHRAGSFDFRMPTEQNEGNFGRNKVLGKDQESLVVNFDLQTEST